MRYFFQVGALVVLGIVFYGCHQQPGERQLQKGVQALERGEYVQAKSALLQAVNERPGSAVNAEAYNYLGLASWRLGELQNARDAFENAHKLDPDLPGPVYNLGLIMLESGDRAAAVSLLDEASRSDVRDTRALEYLSVIYAREGNREEARRILYEALGRAPGSPRILTAIANVEYAMGLKEEARHRWMSALESDSRYAPALFNLAWVNLGAEGRMEDAQAYARDFYALDADRDQVRRLRRALAEARGEEGPSPDGGTPPAREDEPHHLLEEARAVAQELPPRALHLCFEAASLARRAGDLAAERRAYETAVQLVPDQPRAHFALGRLLMERNEFNGAKRHLLQAATLRPDWVDANRLLAECAIRTRDFDTALTALQRVMQRQEADQESLWMLAELYDRHLQRPEDAVRAYRRFRNQFPGDPRILRAAERIEALEARPPAPARNQETRAEPPPARRVERVERPVQEPAPSVVDPPASRRGGQASQAHFNRGVSLQQGGRDAEAIEAYQAAVVADPSLARAHFNMGVIYSRRNDLDRAQQAYRLAIAQDPSMEGARYNLALLHFNRQQYPQASSQLTAVLDRNPDHARAHYLMGRMLAQQPGQQRMARWHYDHFLRLAPDDPNAPAVRQWIQRAAAN